MDALNKTTTLWVKFGVLLSSMFIAMSCTLVLVPRVSLAKHPRKNGALFVRAIVSAIILYLASILSNMVPELGLTAGLLAPSQPFLWVTALNMVKLLLISRIDAQQLAGGKDPRQVGVVRQAMDAVIRAINFRHMGLNDQIKDLREPPNMTRLNFLLTGLVCFIVGYIFVDFQNQAPLPDKHLVTYEKQQLFFTFWNLNAEDYIFRDVATAGFWQLSYLWIRVMYRGVALVSVGLGLSEPERWIPLFGSPSHLYTLRGFWGYALHNIIVEDHANHSAISASSGTKRYVRPSPPGRISS